jgi:hypothetical protein
MTDRLMNCFEQASFRSQRGIESLRAGDAETVDVAAQLKEMW